MSPALLEREYRIHYYEVDYKKRALFTSLMNYLNDLAMLQSENLGVGLEYASKNHVAWVLYQWNIKVKKYPMYNESVLVKTAPHSFRKFYAYRWFEIYNKKGEKLVDANSVWLLVDRRKKRPIKIPDYLYKAYGVDKSKQDILQIGEIEQMSTVTSKKEFNVRYMDIDTNNHVNNVKYVAWALETVPMDIVLNYILCGLKVVYKKEATYDKSICALTQVVKADSKIICLHKITDKDDRELCLLESCWINCNPPYHCK